MSRTVIIAFIMTALLMGRAALAAPACGDRIQGFVAYEDYDDQLRPAPGVSLFKVEGYSPDSAFEGLVVKNKEDRGTKIEVEIREAKNGPATKTLSFETLPWDKKEGYFIAKDLAGEDLFGEEFDGFFVLRLKLNGRVLCEDKVREVESGH